MAVSFLAEISAYKRERVVQQESLCGSWRATAGHCRRQLISVYQPVTKHKRSHYSRRKARIIITRCGHDARLIGQNSAVQTIIYSIALAGITSVLLVQRYPGMITLNCQDSLNLPFVLLWRIAFIALRLHIVAQLALE